ncbi:hypothetical protein A4X06_0g2359 [Tilletia controversa]|uniref:CBS domain-containing protein n=1 Tax=Tilletia controversa TaxID=13291 RepID=A0A8X7MXT6_9BASI|nr:hypothetical protein CF328_g7460 [Tilletia controversa]KAE8252199.1 hypothetical protein A4X06_0g2359 [Tilletia controversa]
MGTRMGVGGAPDLSMPVGSMGRRGNSFLYIPDLDPQDLSPSLSSNISLSLSALQPSRLRRTLRSRYVVKLSFNPGPLMLTDCYLPSQLVRQYFTRLGVRYIVVVDERGLYSGIIFKKRCLEFLEDCERIKLATSHERLSIGCQERFSLGSRETHDNPSSDAWS